MEVDIGAAVSIMGEKTVQEMFPEVQLKKSDIVLKTYTAESMEVVGEIDVEVEYQGQTEKLVLVVIGPSYILKKMLLLSFVRQGQYHSRCNNKSLWMA